MMTGRVTALREATIRLAVSGPDQCQHAVDAVLDTGFNGFLTLPSHLVQTLQPPFAGHRRASLEHGTIVVLDLYLATVLWHEQAREVLVLQTDGGPLVGMALLYGSRVV
jgi:clan AA aspartic protease